MYELGKDDAQKVTNLDYLLKLSKGNDEFVKDMITIFLEENPAEIRTLEKAIEDRNFRQINAAAHKLRSTVPFVGIDKMISGDISEIEHLALVEAGDPMDETSQPEKKSFLPTDREVIAKIERLFRKIKQICFRAYEELKPFTSH
jgi:hypothetical protein